MYLMSIIFFFFNDTATTEIYTLSLHDALPIWVGMQMSPQLSRVLGRVHPGMLQGQGLLPTEAGAVGLAVICTFSLPIITLVALIVMFLFLLLFNIIFWWLPFFMICFPIPRRK